MSSNDLIIRGILEKLGCTMGNLTRGYVHATCPLAQWRHESGVDRHPSFGVVYSSAEAKKEEGHAHCFSCGYSGDIGEIASLMHVWGALSKSELGDIMNEVMQIKTGNLPLSLTQSQQDDPFPDPAWLASFPVLAREHKDAVVYMNGRGILGEATKHFDVRFDPKRWRVSVPLYDRAQRFRGMIGRTLIVDPQGPRYFYYPYKGNAPRGFTWANEHRLDLSKPVVVVEGIFDAMKVWPAYQNVVAALSVSFRRPAMGWHRDVSRWVTMFDQGKGGMLARARLQTHVAKTGDRIWHLDPPPGRNDPGDATAEEISQKLAETFDTVPVVV